MCWSEYNVHLNQETDVIVNQVLDELGISLDHELSDIIPGLDKPHIAQQAAPVSYIIELYMEFKY